RPRLALSWPVGYAICINLPRTQPGRFGMQRTLARFGVLAVCLIAIAPPVGAQNQPITIRAARVIDGKGKVLPNTVVEVQGSKITKIDTRGGAVTYDLGDRTLMPGLIDVHVHIGEIGRAHV